MRKYELKNLSKLQLKRLRSDVCLCSLYISDYKNRYDIDARAVCDFFDGFADFLAELMNSAGFDGDNNFFDYLAEYDTIENLYDYFSMIEWI